MKHLRGRGSYGRTQKMSGIWSTANFILFPFIKHSNLQIMLELVRDAARPTRHHQEEASSNRQRNFPFLQKLQTQIFHEIQEPVFTLYLSAHTIKACLNE